MAKVPKDWKAAADAKESFFPDITRLIRSVQRREGNPDCFGRAGGKCAELVCAWRTYCLENHGDPKTG